MNKYFRYENNDCYDYEPRNDNTKITVENDIAYYRQIKSIPRLKRNEELRLYQKYLKGDEAARDELIESQLNMVVEVAKLYTNRGVDLDDLVQEGNLILSTSIDKYVYKPNLGISSFARQEIHRHLIRFVETAGKPVRVPSYFVEDIEKIKRARDVLQQNLFRTPTYQDIASYVHMTYDEVRQLFYHAADYLADENDTGFQDEHFDYIVDSEAPAIVDQVRDNILHETLCKQLKTLTRQEELVIKMRYGFDLHHPQTLDETGRVLKVTRERIRQIEKKALRKLRHPLRSRFLKHLLATYEQPEPYFKPLYYLALAGVVPHLEIRTPLSEPHPFDATSNPITVAIPKKVTKQKQLKSQAAPATYEYDDEPYGNFSRHLKNIHTPISDTKDLEYNLYSDRLYNIEYSHFDNSKNALTVWVMNFSKKPIIVSCPSIRIDGNIARKYQFLGGLQPNTGGFFVIPVSLAKEGTHEIKTRVELLDENVDNIGKSRMLSLVVNYDLEYSYIK